MASRFKTAWAAAVALAGALHFSPALAAAHLTFVSATGSDAQPCTIQVNPCRTLQKAQDETLPGGEVRVLSNLSVVATTTINRSITVEGGGHTIFGAIVINNANALVTLRNLNLNGRTVTTTGINIVNAASVHVENCTIERYVEDGIALAANVSTELFVANSVTRDSGRGLIVLGPTSARLTVENSRFENNADAGVTIRGGRASISRSVLSGNVNIGLFVDGGSTNVIETTAADGAIGFVVAGGGAMTIESSNTRGNQLGLNVSSASTARISNSVFTNNGTGILNAAGGTVLTLGNNLVAGNATNVSGVLTPQAAQ
jgi:hypothetical protein